MAGTVWTFNETTGILALAEAGYGGGITLVKDYVHRIRPRQQPAFLKLDFQPGECAQIDWTFLGQSMPFWVGAFLLLTLLLALYNGWRQTR